MDSSFTYRLQPLKSELALKTLRELCAEFKLGIYVNYDSSICKIVVSGDLERIWFLHTLYNVYLAKIIKLQKCYELQTKRRYIRRYK